MRGRFRSFAKRRGLVRDIVHFSKKTTRGAISRDMVLGALVDAVRDAPVKVPFTALFARAFARVAADTPELRQARVGLPWPGLYEYPASVGIIAMEREIHGETWLVFAELKTPDTGNLAEQAARLLAQKNGPFRDYGALRRQVRYGSLPILLRRPLVWLALNVGRLRARYFGTFGVSSVAGEGAAIDYGVHPLTSLIAPGPFAPDGRCRVLLSFDHRVYDGRVAAQTLRRMEAELTGEILAEVRALGGG